ncbi:MAG: CopG family transcriptional regulator [Acidobacteriota bacterium]
MRTTVTLDDDVAALLKKAMRERGLSFKDALNGAVRAGMTVPRPKAGRFRQKTYPMGFDPSFRWDKALSIAADMEDEEIVRKLHLRK